jgi:DNA-binding response OmpR family regulator
MTSPLPFQAGRRQGAHAPAVPLPAGAHILVVEDDYHIARLVCRGLEAEGAVVMGPAAGVEGALALLEGDARPDAAVLDVNLGGELVYPVAERLRELSVPFLFTTGYDQERIVQAYADVPVCEKPYSHGRLLGRLGQLLQGT